MFFDTYSYRKKLLYNQAVVVKYDMTYPIFGRDQSLGRINQYNKSLIEGMVSRSSRNLYKDGVKQYKTLVMYNSFAPIEVKDNFNVMFTSSRIMSLFWDFYISRGAEGIMMHRVSQTWDINKSVMLTMDSIFRRDKNWRNTLMEVLKNEVSCFESEMGISCFSGWQSVICNSLDHNRFYISDSGIVIYCPQGSIAADVWGIPSFLASFSELDTILDKKFSQSLQ